MDNDNMKNMIELTETNFETEVLQASVPVVVDFYAPWCGPCKMLAPILEQLAPQFEGRVKFAKLNVDEAPELAGRYGSTSAHHHRRRFSPQLASSTPSPSLSPFRIPGSPLRRR